MSQGEWHAQVEEVQRRQDEDARLIEEHREWKKAFKSWATPTNAKNEDNETTNTTEVR